MSCCSIVRTRNIRTPRAASFRCPAAPTGSIRSSPSRSLPRLPKRFGSRRESAWCRSTTRSCWPRKSRASIRLSGGRFALGVGIGWSAEEFAALGIPFERRAQRTREYIEVMRRLWSDDAATFHGEFVNFDAAKSFPKPARGGKLPIIFGGESGPALRRTADIGNGWFGFNVGPDDAAPLADKLRAMLKANGRDASEVEIIVCPYTKKITPDDLKKYGAGGRQRTGDSHAVRRRTRRRSRDGSSGSRATGSSRRRRSARRLRGGENFAGFASGRARFAP